MVKVFSPTLPLSVNGTTQSKLIKYNKDVDELFTFLGHTITAFIGGRFLKVEDIKPCELKVGSETLSLCDASQYIDMALQHADQYTHDLGIHDDFVKRFSGLLVQEFPVLMACAARYLAVDLSDTFEADQVVIQSALTSSVVSHLSPVVSYCIGDHETDIVLHLSRIIKYIRRPYTGINHRGVVVQCCSPCLLPVMFLFCHLVERAQPPASLLAFLPTLAHMQNNSLTANLNVILNSADIDSAVRSCINSVFAGCGTKSWQSSIVFVEESVEQRVLKKLKHVLSTDMHSTNSLTLNSVSINNQFDKVDHYLKNTILAAGGEIIRSNGEAFNGPIFIANIELSVLPMIPFGQLPLVHFFRFRTPKEAISLATHCINHMVTRYDSVFDSHKRVDFCANLWTSSFCIAWYIAAALAKSGLSNVFVNAAHLQLMDKMYRLSLESDRVNYYSSLQKTNISKDVMIEECEIVKILSMALKAQTRWSDIGARDREKKLQIASDALGDQIKAVFRIMWALFTTSIEKAIGNFDNSELTSMNKDHLLLAHEWLLPAGPIVVLVPYSSDKNVSSMLMHVCLYAFCTGNSVVLMNWKAPNSDVISHVNALCSLIPSKDLLSIYNCPSGRTVSDISNTLAGINHPGVVLPHVLLEPLPNADDVHGYFTNFETFQPWKNYFSRSVKLLWSAGDNTFID